MNDWFFKGIFEDIHVDMSNFSLVPEAREKKCELHAGRGWTWCHSYHHGMMITYPLILQELFDWISFTLCPEGLIANVTHGRSLVGKIQTACRHVLLDFLIPLPIRLSYETCIWFQGEYTLLNAIRLFGRRSQNRTGQWLRHCQAQIHLWFGPRFQVHRVTGQTKRVKHTGNETFEISHRDTP